MHQEKYIKIQLQMFKLEMNKIAHPLEVGLKLAKEMSLQIHYNNRGLFCNPNIIANNKERSFQKPAVANHNSSQTLKLLRYHNIRTRTIASPS